MQGWDIFAVKQFFMKKSSIFLCAGLLLGLLSFAQKEEATDTSWLKQPRFTPKRINDLVHTRLDVRFDYSKSHLLGKAWITLTPHLYATDSLTLDAKGMEIHALELSTPGKPAQALRYSYNRKQLHITLPRLYQRANNIPSISAIQPCQTNMKRKLEGTRC